MPPATRVAPGPGQESVWDYPRPPRVEPSEEAVEVILGGAALLPEAGAALLRREVVVA